MRFKKSSVLNLFYSRQVFSNINVWLKHYFGTISAEFTILPALHSRQKLRLRRPLPMPQNFFYFVANALK
jgi:hypothetical protein